MSVALITSLPIGNAIKVLLQPPRLASSYLLLRNETGVFSGPDPDVAIDSGAVDRRNIVFVDTQSVVNGVEYHYQPYYLIASEWTAGTPGKGTAAATYVDRSVDAFSVVRQRIEDAMKVEVERGALRHETGAVPVLSAPPQFDETRWPVVTVHLQQETPTERALGEDLYGDEKDGEQWEVTEGWLAQSQITVVGWSLNPDERIDLRKALRRIIVGNLPVFDAALMTDIRISIQDMEDFTSYSAPVYQAMATINCLAPVVVAGRVGQITGVNTTVSAES